MTLLEEGFAALALSSGMAAISLAIHPASTIFSDFSLSERAKLGVSEGLVRLSSGIENIEDLINELRQAFN